MRIRRSTALLLLAFAVAACDETRRGTADAGGTLVISTGGEADFLLPPLTQNVTSKQVNDQIFEPLAEIGPELNTTGDDGFRPRLARSWDWARDSMSIAFHIDPRARWQDGAPVRAADVRLSWELLADPVVAAPGRHNISNIDSVTVRDSLTAVIWFREKRPSNFFDGVHHMWIVPAHLLSGADRANIRSSSFVRNPVGSGPYRFVTWEPGTRIELEADPDHWNGRPNLDRLIWSIAPDPVTAVTRLFAGEADFFESMRVDNLRQSSSQQHIKLIPYSSLGYGYLGFNLRNPRSAADPHPVFSDRALRRALSMAVDRERLVRNVFDTLALVAAGPFPRAAGPPADAMPSFPYDPDAARRMLDSLGWRDQDGDGFREKDGRRLRFAILAPSSSQPRMNYAVLLQEQFRQVGAQVDVESMEFASFISRIGAGNFDAVLGQWNTDPGGGGVRQTWGTGGVGNHGRYSNPRFDAMVDSALAAFAPDTRRTYFTRAYSLMIEDAPGIWLYEPRPIAGAHRRLQVTGMRADAWWAGIPHWSIPADQRIRRDSIGLRPRAE